MLQWLDFTQGGMAIELKYALEQQTLRALVLFLLVILNAAATGI